MNLKLMVGIVLLIISSNFAMAMEKALEVTRLPADLQELVLQFTRTELSKESTSQENTTKKDVVKKTPEELKELEKRFEKIMLESQIVRQAIEMHGSAKVPLTYNDKSLKSLLEIYNRLRSSALEMQEFLSKDQIRRVIINVTSIVESRPPQTLLDQPSFGRLDLK